MTLGSLGQPIPNCTVECEASRVMLWAASHFSQAPTTPWSVAGSTRPWHQGMSEGEVVWYLLFAFDPQVNSGNVFLKDIVGDNCCHYYTLDSLFHFSPCLFILPTQYCGDLFHQLLLGRDSPKLQWCTQNHTFDSESFPSDLSVLPLLSRLQGG